MSAAAGEYGERAGAGPSLAARVLRPVAMGVGVAAALAAAALWWLSGAAGFSTDDAYVRAAKLAVATDVSGVVAEVSVREGARVAPGAVLFRLDPAPFQNAVDAARAALDATLLRLEAEKRDYRRMLREEEARRAEVANDEAELARFEGLVKGGGVTRADYDRARFRLRADRAAAEALGVQAEVQLARLGGDATAPARSLPAAREAAAKLAEAERQLAHTVVRAPFGGVVTNVESLQPGQYLAASTAAFGLVSDSNVWVEAYPKETQLTGAAAGDRAVVRIDTYPGRVWEGVLESISPASGASFAVLPAQNASGNWVKVVQRIPVRVRIVRAAGDPPLRDGMSVDLRVVTGKPKTVAEMMGW